jgi:predicted component of type VI protein secretion system
MEFNLRRNSNSVLITREFTRADSPIVIGRNEKAKVHVNDSSFSRVQCRILFEDSEWCLLDGDKNKKSTNGTWLYAEDPFPIHDEMEIKAGSLLFKTHLN